MVVSACSIILLLASISAIGLRSGNCQLVCDIGFEICYDECFDPKTLQCIQSESESDSIVCSIGMKACGNLCYSGSDSEVCLQQDGISVVCSIDEQQCGWECYSPSTSKCLGGVKACGLNEELCGKSCYVPGQDLICTAHGRVCPAGQESCGHRCYVPSPDKTCSGSILCSEGKQLCGHSCYSEVDGEICSDGYAVCKAGQVSCGKYECYFKHDGNNCFIEEGSVLGTLCEPDEHACEGKCYNVNKHGCFPYRGSGKTCPIGLVGCGGTECYSATSGDVACLENRHGEEQLCKLGQELCGSTCFNPGPEYGFKCFRTQTVDVLCKNTDKVCGENCFNPKAQVCHPTPSPFVNES